MKHEFQTPIVTEVTPPRGEADADTFGVDTPLKLGHLSLMQSLPDNVFILNDYRRQEPPEAAA